MLLLSLTLSQTTDLDFSKLKEFANNNFRFDENSGKLSKTVENAVGKGKLLVTSNFSFSHGVFKRPVLQTRKNEGLSGKGSINLLHQSKRFYLSLVFPYTCIFLCRLILCNTKFFNSPFVYFVFLRHNFLFKALQENHFALISCNTKFFNSHFVYFVFLRHNFSSKALQENQFALISCNTKFSNSPFVYFVFP